MAVDQEARDLINQILAEFATRPDGGTWGVPRDFSVLLRQNQPPASGTSQFKVEDLELDAGDIILRDAAGGIIATNILELPEETTPVAGDFVLLQKADGTFMKLAAENLMATPAQIAAAVWDEPKAGHSTAGTMGEEQQLHALSSEIAGLNNLSAPEVNAEVVDVLKTDTIAQRPQGAPPATPTIEEAIMYLYQRLRNKTEQTATEQKMYDDAGTTVIAKAAVSDDGTTATKGEFVTGP